MLPAPARIEAFEELDVEDVDRSFTVETVSASPRIVEAALLMLFKAERKTRDSGFKGSILLPPAAKMLLLFVEGTKKGS